MHSYRSGSLSPLAAFSPPPPAPPFPDYSLHTAMLPQNIDVDLNALPKMDFSIQRLGTPTLDSPLKEAIFVEDTERICYCADAARNQLFLKECKMMPAFLAAGRP